MEQARAQLTDTSVLRGKLEGEIAVLQNVHTDAVVAEVYKAVIAARGRICALHVILRQRS